MAADTVAIECQSTGGQVDRCPALVKSPLAFRTLCPAPGVEILRILGRIGGL
jgi:hypothetical protein